MKYRSDFVTNSSSSSFIVIFEKSADYDSAVDYLGTIDEQKRNLILKDLEENKRTRRAILSAIRTYLKREYDFKLFYRGGKTYEERIAFRNSPAFRVALKDILDKEMEKISSSLPPRAMYYGILHYSDEDGAWFSDIEHNVVPKMPGVFKRLSYH